MNNEGMTSEAKKILSEILKRKDIYDYLQILKNHHKESYFHSKRVALICCKMGILNDLSKKDLERIAISGLLHDIGKLDIPQKVLNLKREINLEERKIVQKHARNGFLKLKEKGMEEIGKIIITHHECKIDPYPRRKSNENTIFERRKNNIDPQLKCILAISDMYDSLKHKRSYKKALRKVKIKKILEKEFLCGKIYIGQVLLF